VAAILDGPLLIGIGVALILVVGTTVWAVVRLQRATGALSVVEVWPSGTPLKAQLAREATKATAAGRRPFVYACSEILPPSIAIDQWLSDPQMQDAFADVHVIRVDVHEWGAPHSEPLLAGTGLTLDRCPVFYELDETGTVTGREIDSGAWDEDVPENMAPVLKAFFEGR
jgi:hypothetical protein